MPVFPMQTRLSPEALHQRCSCGTRARHVPEQLRRHCPGVRGLASHALPGPGDHVDVFEAPDIGPAMRVSVLVRSQGHAGVQIWPALAWTDFENLLPRLPGRP